MNKLLLLITLFPLFVFGQLRINEASNANGTTVVLPSGATPDWIEIYNMSSLPADIAGYGLSDKRTIPLKWVFPAQIITGNQFFMAYPDNFSIASHGEIIYLSDPNGTIIDSLMVLDLEPNMSIGKFPDGGVNTTIFTNPTPNASNNSSVYYLGYEEPATISTEGGVFPGSISINVINNSTNNGVLRYTINGRNPTVNSPVLASGLNLSVNCVLRVTCFPSASSNLLPSQMVTETYLFQEHFTLPIVSLTIDSLDLYGGNGIFDNWWTDWRKPCDVAYFDVNGVKQFQTRASVKPDGGAGGSRSNPQHSVTIEPAHSVYGEGVPVHYPIIPEKPFIQDYYALYIRNGSNYWNQYPQKDATFERIMRKSHANSQAYTPAIVFLNGNYFGVYELREKANEGYFENNYGNDRDSLDLLSVSYFYGAGVLRTVKGSDSSFYNMRDLIMTADPNAPNYFDLCHQKLDLYNFTDYLVGENWFGNSDWIYNNMKMARTRTYDNKWRFFLQDLEWGLGGWTDYNSNLFDYFRYGNQPNPFWDIYNGLVHNTNFKNYFVNRFADLMNTTFQNDYYKPIVDSMYTQLLPEMPRHFQLWTGDVAGGMNNYNYIHTMHLAQFNNRNAVVRNQIVNEFALVKKVNVNLDVFPANAGYIKISTIVPETLPWTGVYFDGVPVKITAVANPGYTFQHWEANLTIPSASLLQESVNYNISSDDLFKAVFVGAPAENTLTISEINYNPDPTVDGGNWVELHNYGTNDIDLTAWTLKSKLHWDLFEFADLTKIPANGYLVICENLVKFNALHPDVTNVVGGSGFVWSNKFDSIQLFDPYGNLKLLAVYTDENPFPKCADGWGRTLENKHADNSILDENTWFCGCISGSPGKAYTPCEEPINISEFNFNNIDQQYNSGDWIEILNTSSNSIALGGMIFKDGKSSHQFIMPDVSLQPNAYLVIGNDLNAFTQRHPHVENVIGVFDFGLSAKDGIRIYNSNGVLINSFLYDTIAPWSNIPATQDYTFESAFNGSFIDPNNGLSWFVGCEGGSPGEKFASCPVLPEGLAYLYPNPSASSITITVDNTVSGAGETYIMLYDLSGRLILKQTMEKVQESVMQLNIDISSYLHGMYFVKVSQSNRSITLPFVKI